MKEDIDIRDYLSEYGDVSYEVSKYLPRSTLQNLMSLNKQLLETSKKITVLTEAAVPLEKLFILRNRKPVLIYKNLKKFEGDILVKKEQLPYLMIALRQLNINSLNVFIILDDVENLSFDIPRSYYSLIADKDRVFIQIKQRGYVQSHSSVLLEKSFSLLSTTDYSDYSDIVHIKITQIISHEGNVSRKRSEQFVKSDLKTPSALVIDAFLNNAQKHKGLEDIEVIHFGQRMSLTNPQLIENSSTEEQRANIKVLYMIVGGTPKNASHVYEYHRLFPNAHIFIEVPSSSPYFASMKKEYKSVVSYVTVLAGEKIQKIKRLYNKQYNVGNDEIGDVLEILRQYNDIQNITIKLLDQVSEDKILDFLELCYQSKEVEIIGEEFDYTMTMWSLLDQNDDLTFECKIIDIPHLFSSTKSLYIDPTFINDAIVDKINDGMIDVHHIEVKIDFIDNYDPSVYSRFIPHGLLLSIAAEDDVIEDINYPMLSEFISNTPNFTHLSFAGNILSENVIRILTNLYNESDETTYPHITLVLLIYSDEEELNLEESIIKDIFPNAIIY